MLQNKQHNLSSNKFNLTKYLRKGVGVLSKMSNPYKASSVLGKQQILKAIFPFDFEIVNEKCRTPRINEVLSLVLSIDGDSGEIKRLGKNHSWVNIVTVGLSQQGGAFWGDKVYVEFEAMD